MTPRPLLRSLAVVCLGALCPTAPAQSGSEALAGEIAEQIAIQYEAISDFKAAVLLSATLGPPQAKKVKRYSAIRGHILYRRPADLRIMGSDPLAHVVLFDLVSDGPGFRLSLPTKKRFLTGSNDSKTGSANKLENIRPSHLVEVLVPKPVDPAREAMVLETPSAGGYILRLTRGERPSRTLWIDGGTLHIARELIFDSAGKTLTDARFSQWSVYDDTVFPKRIEIDRPQEEYKLLLQIQTLEIDRGLPSGAFVLEPPHYN
jgi:outer membrane lipoprotein-sorting protein